MDFHGVVAAVGAGTVVAVEEVIRPLHKLHVVPAPQRVEQKIVVPAEDPPEIHEVDADGFHGCRGGSRFSAGAARRASSPAKSCAADTSARVSVVGRPRTLW